jgi:Fe-S-cluster formation regulator IscX/YfhJ
MNWFKFQALCREFPFLAEIVTNEEEVTEAEVRIARIDGNLLTFTPRYRGATGDRVGICDEQNIHFILKDGTFVRYAVLQDIEITHNEAYQDDESRCGETVLDAIERLGLEDNLALIVSEAKGYVIRDHYSVGGCRVVVFKPTKKCPLSKTLAEARARAQELVAAEIAALDE